MSSFLGMIKRLLPSPYFKHIQVMWYRMRSELIYLETHLTDHCNLNCKSCRHFSPISPPRFSDQGAFRRDMRRLRELFRNIRVIRLMGGEPLLHPHAQDFIRLARESFPRAELHLVTNGLLLPRMASSFWQRCARDRVIIDLTRYPIPIKLRAIRTAAGRFGVALDETVQATMFHKYHMDRSGGSDSWRSFRACREQSYSPFLDVDSGRLYTCAVSATAHIAAGYFDQDLIVTPRDSICIHSEITPAQIIDFLNRPAPFCRYCTTKRSLFAWSRSRFQMEEWFD